MEQPKHVDLRGLLTFQIMNELNKRRMTGDELAQIIGDRKGSKLSPGTIYPALKKLREKRLVKVTKDGRKVFYELSVNGKKEFRLARKIVRKIVKEI